MLLQHWQEAVGITIARNDYARASGQSREANLNCTDVRQC